MPLGGVPVVDLAGVVRLTRDELTLSNPVVAKTVKEIKNACINWGFFYIMNHGVDETLIGDLKTVMNEFFHMPKEFKKLISRHSKNFHGWSEKELTKNKEDWKEAFDIGKEHDDEAALKREIRVEVDPGKNQWPEGMPEFKSVYNKWFSQIHAVGSHIMDIIFLALDTDPKDMIGYFNEKSDTSWCRMNYYPICKDPNDEQLGVGPHTDSGVLTILLQDDDVNSLEVEKDGEWHEVSPIPGSFVINIGDMMQVWSNGQFKAPVHRVQTNTGKERYSVPFFLNPSYVADVSPLPHTITNERPNKYRPVNWGIFHQTRMEGNYNDLGEEIQIHHFEISA